MKKLFLILILLFSCSSIPYPPPANSQEYEEFVFNVNGRPASEFFRSQLNRAKNFLIVGSDTVGKLEIFDIVNRKVYPAGFVGRNLVEDSNFLRDWHLRFTTPFDTTEVQPDSLFFVRINGGSDVKWRMGAEIGKSGKYFVEWFNKRSKKWTRRANPHIGNPRGFLKGPAKKRGRKPKRVKK